VHVNWLAPAKVRRTIVGGSKRMVVYDDMEPSEKVKVYDQGVTITRKTSPDEVYEQLVAYRQGDVLVPRLDAREALNVEAEHILRCIRTGERPTSDGTAGLRTVRILEAAQQSIRAQSRPVSLGRATPPRGVPVGAARDA
jgi:predicted dehydrogenase